MIIERCRIAHLHELRGALRAEERSEMDRLVIKYRHGMIGCWKMTPEPWAAIDEYGHVLAAWGDAASTLASEGLPWVFTSSWIERYPLWFFRTARVELQKMLLSRETLRCSIGADCTKALRFYAMLGFVIDNAVDGFHEIRMMRNAVRP
jgi:hypothetical protein